MPDHSEIADVLVGKEALEGLAQELAAVDAAATRVPRVDQTGLVRRLLVVVAALTALQTKIAAQVSADNAQRVQLALTRLPRIARALLYAQTRHRAAQLDINKPTRGIDEVLRWRAPMLATLATLETLGHVSAQQANHIRAGRGNLDAARDAVELTAFFDEKWAVVEPLQALQTDPALRISREVLASVQESALRFIEASEEADALLPAEARLLAWEQHLRALITLLEQDWDALRHAAEYAHKNKAISIDLDDLASANALTRRG